MHPSVQIDATFLTDEELDAISVFLSNVPAIQDVSVATIGFNANADKDALRLQATGEPLFLCVNFVSKHWSQITAGATEAYAGAKAGVWLAEQLRGWCSRRNMRYELKPLFDGRGQILKMVRVKKQADVRS